MAKLEAIRADVARVEAMQRSHSENISGLYEHLAHKIGSVDEDVSDINVKMAAILRALDNPERTDLAVARRNKVASVMADD